MSTVLLEVLQPGGSFPLLKSHSVLVLLATCVHYDITQQITKLDLGCMLRENNHSVVDLRSMQAFAVNCPCPAHLLATHAISLAAHIASQAVTHAEAFHAQCFHERLCFEEL